MPCCHSKSGRSANGGNAPSDEHGAGHPLCAAAPAPDAAAASADRPDRRLQVGALCWRRAKRGLKVLLVTSRDTGRWIIPKGWPITSLGLAGSAQLEAWEEAGARGTTGPEPIGAYDYDKRRATGRVVACRVQVYALAVRELADQYPECTQRRRRWFRPAKAASRVDEPELAALLRMLETLETP